MRHTIKMLIGCVLPLLPIFVLPLFGISEGVSLLVFVVLMFGCHLFMMGGHGGHGGHEGHSNHGQGETDGRSERKNGS